MNGTKTFGIGPVAHCDVMLMGISEKTSCETWVLEWERKIGWEEFTFYW